MQVALQVPKCASACLSVSHLLFSLTHNFSVVSKRPYQGMADPRPLFQSRQVTSGTGPNLEFDPTPAVGVYVGATAC